MLERPDQKDIADEAKLDVIHRSQTSSFQEEDEKRDAIISALPHANGQRRPSHDEEETKGAAPDDEIGTSEIGDASKHVYSQISTGEDDTVIEVKEETPDLGEYVIQPSTYYRARNLIDLNNSTELQLAAMTYKDQSAAKQEQLIEYYKALINLSKKNHKPLSNQLTLVPTSTGEIHAFKSPFEALPEDKQKEILDYYIQNSNALYRFLVTQGFLGYMGEGFYLYWDMRSRMKVFDWFFPNAPDAANMAINYTATAPITLANITYWPPSDARGYMQNKMLYEKSFTEAIRLNPFKTLMFFIYAFGGGYVEIVFINDDLDSVGKPAKFTFEAFLMYAAVLYYTAFQFADVIDKSAKYAKMPSLLKRALNISNDRTFEERWTDLFNGMHEALCVIERILRMGYGGVEAGLQQSGQALAYILGGTVGVATVPIAYALRTVPIRDMYNLDAYSSEQISDAMHRFDMKYASTFLTEDGNFDTSHAIRFLKGELKLFLTPTLLLITPGAVWSTSYATGAVDDLFAKIAVGTLTSAASLATLHYGLFLRYPAKRRAIVDEILHEAKPAPGSIVPNTAAYAVSGTVNLCDQTSRVITFGYVMGVMFPEVFNLDSTVGSNLLMTILFLDAFIAISAWLYQMDKSAEAFKGYSHTYFGKKLPRPDGSTPLLGAAPEAAGNPFDEEEKHDAALLLPANDPHSDESTPSRCVMM